MKTLEVSYYFMLLSFMALCVSVKGCHWRHRCKYKHGCIVQGRLNEVFTPEEVEKMELEESKKAIIRVLFNMRLHPWIVQCSVDKLEGKKELNDKKRNDWEEKIALYLKEDELPKSWRKWKKKFCVDHADKCLMVEICMVNFVEGAASATPPPIAILKFGFSHMNPRYQR